LRQGKRKGEKKRRGQGRGKERAGKWGREKEGKGEREEGRDEIRGRVLFPTF